MAIPYKSVQMVIIKRWSVYMKGWYFMLRTECNEMINELEIPEGIVHKYTRMGIKIIEAKK